MHAFPTKWMSPDGETMWGTQCLPITSGATGAVLPLALEARHESASRIGFEIEA